MMVAVLFPGMAVVPLVFLANKLPDEIIVAEGRKLRLPKIGVKYARGYIRRFALLWSRMSVASRLAPRMSPTLTLMRMRLETFRPADSAARRTASISTWSMGSRDGRPPRFRPAAPPPPALLPLTRGARAMPVSLAYEARRVT